MELPRILLIATSVMLLVYRYGYGGIGELKALAEVRVDVADGSLDGFADTKKLEHSKKHSTHITHKVRPRLLDPQREPMKPLPRRLCPAASA